MTTQIAPKLSEFRVFYVLDGDDHGDEIMGTTCALDAEEAMAIFENILAEDEFPSTFTILRAERA